MGVATPPSCPSSGALEVPALPEPGHKLRTGRWEGRWSSQLPASGPAGRDWPCLPEWVPGSSAGRGVSRPSHSRGPCTAGTGNSRRGLTLDPSQCGQGRPEFPSRALLGSSSWLVVGPAAVDPGAWGTRGGGARVFPMKGASGSSGIHQPFLTPTRPPPQKRTPCSKARGNVPGRSRWGRGLAPGGARAPVSGAGRALCPWQRP